MNKDKRIPVPQAMQVAHEFYDDLEHVSLAAIEKVLHDEFGFGPQRFERFKAAYLEQLGAEAEKLAEEMRKKIKRRIG